MDLSVEELKRRLESQGYVVLKATSYRRAQERQRIAEARREAAERHEASVRSWAHSCLAEERRLADRLTRVYGVARARGATIEELA